MNSYPAGALVAVTIPFVDMNGAAISPAGMTLAYRVLDELENIVQDTTALAAPGSTDTSVLISVPEVCNQLAGPAPNINDGTQSGNLIITVSGLREIQLTMTTPTGAFVSKIQYILRASDAQLVLLQNSFQTYNLALLTASNLPNLTAFPTATEQDRINAMSTAWLRLTKLGYFVRDDDAALVQLLS